jgi:uncharacterized phage protein (TIGR01671 family)
MYEVVGRIGDMDQLYFIDQKLGLVHADFEDFILMQCTGLKDKHGVLIFEGDIVKGDVRQGCALEMYGPRQAPIGVIEWSEWGFFVNDWIMASPCSFFSYHGEGRGGAATNHPDLGMAEIIGNIYENPEILEGTEK